MAAVSRAARPPVAWLPASWTVGLLTLLLAVTTFIGENVPESYMDEPFHVPMTKLYCRGDFSTWDPKITTFPGLYVLGAAYAWLSHILLSWAGLSLDFTCSGPYLRSLNALLTVACIQVAYAVSMELQQQRRLAGSNNSSSSSLQRKDLQHGEQQAAQQEQQQASACVALVVGLLPTQLFFSFLFYTDVPSLLFLLLTELLLLRHEMYAAAAAGAAAIGMRQTNAVWVTFLTGAAMLQDLLQPAAAPANRSSSSRQQQQQHQDERQQQQQAKKQQKLPELLALLLKAWQLKWQLLQDFWLLLVLPAAFVAFVVINGGITLGDREAHAPTSHMMQPLYYALFAAVAGWPLLLQPVVVRRLRGSCSTAPRVLLAAALAAAAAAAAGLVAQYSLVHPYLLADNRHYTFYIWRKVFARHWGLRFALVPVYVAAWLLLLAGLAVWQHWLWVAAFAASCWVTLAPAWLVEFRYFTTPFALAVLHLPLPSRTGLAALLVGYCAVNAATLWVFAKRPYTWGDGSIARFMW